MATNPDDIKLSDQERRRLARLADERGRNWTEIMGELLESAETVLGLQQGLESARRGEGIQSADVHAAIRAKFDLSGK